MKALNENIFHQYNKWKTGYVRKENSLQIKLDNFLSNKHSGVYRISEDGKHVDCDNTVIIWDSDLINGKLPFPFGKVKGTFKCSCRELTSLEGAPKEVSGGFWIHSCTNLTSLVGAPKKVGHAFECNDCLKLTSLEGAPKEVGYRFACSGC